MTTEQPRGPWSIEEVQRRGRLVLHMASGTVGKVRRVYTGEDDDKYVSALNGKAVDAPVMELETGDAFVMGPDAFTLLSEREEVVYTQVAQMLTGMMTVAANLARGAGLSKDMFVVLVGAIITMQQRQLQLAAKESERGGEQAAAGADGDADAGGGAQRGGDAGADVRGHDGGQGPGDAAAEGAAGGGAAGGGGAQGEAGGVQRREGGGGST